MIASEPAGLDKAVVARLNTLKTMKTILEKDGDEREQLPNVNALIEACRSRELSWSSEAKKLPIGTKGSNCPSQESSNLTICSTFIPSMTRERASGLKGCVIPFYILSQLLSYLQLRGFELVSAAHDR